MRFANRVAVVTGAGSGLGRATARRLASEGAAVACVDIAAEAAKQTAADAVDDGARAEAYACDVSDPDSVEAAVAKAVADLGPPHVVCNSAGIGWFARTTEMAPGDWQRILGVNLTGTFLVCRAILPHLVETGGNVVNIASNAGVMGQPYSAAYVASKHGVVGLTRSLALEYREQGVRVNAVAPGGMDTPLMHGFTLPEGAKWRELARVISPWGPAQPEEIAAVVAFVASDEARYMTGAVVSVDGGITA